jgi:uncharacterized phage protein (TIGR01671 family)
MREIKFRVWNKTSEEFTFFDSPIFTLLPNKQYPVAFHNCSDTKRMLGGYGEIEQFAGKQDRNNDDVYEGDIVLYWDDSNEQQIGICQWCDVSCAFGLCAIDGDDEGNQDGDMNRKPIQVIGNIHQNPELLEAK